MEKRYLMLSPLRHKNYRKLFAAQVASLIGTGLTTVALALLAHDMAGAQAGEIIAVVLVIKMTSYIGLAPLASALAAHVPRKSLLVALDLVRAGVAALLPFVAQAWQIYALMAVLYCASAAFTPAFQAMIPDILSDEEEYTKALSLSRLASDLESVVSPVLAAALLAFFAYSDLFAGTALGFLVSGALVAAAFIPAAEKAARPFIKRLSAGLNLFLKTPRLRGLLALSLATASGGAMVFVNTVVLVQTKFGMGEQATAVALSAFGAGSIAAALSLPALLKRTGDRRVMSIGALVMTAGLVVGPWAAANYPALIALWSVLGASYSLTLTPVGRVLRRSSHADDRPTLFAAQFALSHACWLIAYPAAGMVSAAYGTGAAFLALATLCAIGIIGLFALWPAADPAQIAHLHDDLPADHPHLQGDSDGHAHTYLIDDLHQSWPNIY